MPDHTRAGCEEALREILDTLERLFPIIQASEAEQGKVHEHLEHTIRRAGGEVATHLDHLAREQAQRVLEEINIGTGFTTPRMPG